MTQEQIDRFRRRIDRLRTMVELRPQAMLLDTRRMLIDWADEWEQELDEQEKALKR